MFRHASVDSENVTTHRIGFQDRSTDHPRCLHAANEFYRRASGRVGTDG